MNMSNFRRPDIDQLHVAQQSRRDKLRVIHHMNDSYAHNLGSLLNFDQLPLNFITTDNESSSHHFRNNNTSRPPLTTAGNTCYDTSQLLSSQEVVDFADNKQGTRGNQEPNCFINFSRPIPSNSINDTQPRSFNTWKTIGTTTASTSHDHVINSNLVGDNMLHVRSYLPFQELNSSPNLTNSNQNTSQHELVTSLLNTTTHQALSLSLSSLPLPNIHTTQIYEGGMNENMVIAQRNHGPLGPFTGYSAILKSSKYLMLAQQIMDEMCSVAPRPKNIELREVSSKYLLGDVVAYTDSEHGGGMSSSTDSYQPENLQRKAKLLYMQDEVCKRYKQYYQQMQMVISSFESVAGLSAATPYISLALKTVSKHFSCLKNAITDQVIGLRNALGEDLSFPTRKCDNNNIASSSMIKFFDHTFQKHPKGNATNLGEGTHVWRPTRGLPEHAVSILRSWLFDHFLHPYPTDTDKHMLASQTGLTRNQVSNWFINARVRVWKPMVEEIHTLETKGASGTGLVSTKTERKLESECEVDYQEKRSRIEYHVPSNVEGSFMGGFGGLGSVSLTLGLRQSVEGASSSRRPHIRRQQLGGWDFIG